MALALDWMIGRVEARVGAGARSPHRRTIVAAVRGVGGRRGAPGYGRRLRGVARVGARGRGGRVEGFHGVDPPRGGLVADARRAGLRVERKFELGGKPPARLLLAGQIDATPSTTGTSYTAISGTRPETEARPPSTSR